MSWAADTQVPQLCALDCMHSLCVSAVNCTYKVLSICWVCGTNLKHNYGHRQIFSAHLILKFSFYFSLVYLYKRVMEGFVIHFAGTCKFVIRAGAICRDAFSLCFGVLVRWYSVTTGEKNMWDFFLVLVLVSGNSFR